MSQSDQDRLPWFRFFPRDWFDFKVERMSYEATGVYMKILVHMWSDSPDQCSISNNPHHISKSLGLTMLKWKKILKEFQVEGDPIFMERGDRFVSKRLQKEKREGQKLLESKKLAGKKGAAARWHKESTASSVPMAQDGSAMFLPMAKNATYTDTSTVTITDTQKGISTPTDQIGNHLFLLAQKAGIPNTGETIRKYIRAWVMRTSSSTVEKTLMDPQVRGQSVLFIDKLAFNGDASPPKKTTSAKDLLKKAAHLKKPKMKGKKA